MTSKKWRKDSILKFQNSELIIKTARGKLPKTGLNKLKLEEFLQCKYDKIRQVGGNTEGATQLPVFRN
jgi:hypothetical protein